MHHAQRSVHIVRPGARTAATAAKVAAVAPGKWSRPATLSATSDPSTPRDAPPPTTSNWSIPKPSTGGAAQSEYTGFRSSRGSTNSQPPIRNRPRREDAAGNRSLRSTSQLRNRAAESYPGAFHEIARSGSGQDFLGAVTQRTIPRPFVPGRDLVLGSAPHLAPDRSKQSSTSHVALNRSRQTSHFISGDNSRHPSPYSMGDRVRPWPSQRATTSRFRKSNPSTVSTSQQKKTSLKEMVRQASKLPKSKEVIEEAEAYIEDEAEIHSVDIDALLDVGIDDADTSIHLKGPGRERKLAFKERGSLVSHVEAEDLAIPSGSRTREMNSVVRQRKNPTKQRIEHKKVSLVDIYIPSIISVINLAKLLKVRLGTLQRAMIRAGMGADTAHDHMLSSEYSSLLAMEFNRNPVIDDEAAFDIHPPAAAKDRSSLPSRPPVVTIMGHVDHGKTTLLDTLRSASVAKGEAGGITQHIGAFSVPVQNEADKSITFLDTPGHAAFSAMRARGAGVTDIVVVVVAADDGIMPQTREVLDLVKKDSENVGLVIAINKVDKPGADADKVEKELLAAGVQLESYGGDVPCVHVSGLTGQGLDRLLETISLLAEMQDLRAERSGPVHGFVLESNVQKGLGPVATVLLLRGSLSPGTNLICGTTQAKVRLLTSPSGNQVRAVYPGDAVVVSGWKELPGAGDEVLSGIDSDIKKALANRKRKADLEATLQDVDAINNARREAREIREEAVQANVRDRRGRLVEKEVEEEEGPRELKVVVKGDVSGSVEAVAGAIEGIRNHLANVKVVATGVGEVTESDVTRAKAVDGTVIAFSVKVPKHIESLATGMGVPILSSSVIYRLMDEVKERVIKLLPVTIERRVRGEASVLEIFDIHLKAKKIMKVAGCRVTNGVVEKKMNARVVRDGQTVFEGRLDTFRHLKKDITEAGKGLECGMSLELFSDLQAGDMIQMYEEIEIPGTL